MERQLAKSVDLIQESIDRLMGVSFPKNSSSVYHLAVSVAKGAKVYQEIMIGKKLVHLVAFDKTKHDAARALALIQYISNWKGSQFYVRGKLTLAMWNITQVLDCFMTACSCNDWRAHCLKTINDLKAANQHQNHSVSINISIEPKEPPIRKEVKIDRYTFPCSFLSGNFKYQIDHPSSPEDQIQACAASNGCDWCPNFNPNNYKYVGTKTEIREAFT